MIRQARALNYLFVDSDIDPKYSDKYSDIQNHDSDSWDS